MQRRGWWGWEGGWGWRWSPLFTYREEAGDAEKEDGDEMVSSLYMQRRGWWGWEDEDGLLSLLAEDEAGEAEKEDGDEDGLLSYLQRKRLLRLKRRMKIKMVTLFQRKRLVRLRRRMKIKMVTLFTCRGRGWWGWEDEDGLLSLPAEQEAGEAEKMKMVSSIYLQKKSLVRLRRWRWRWCLFFTCREEALEAE
jgi:hypothetical protein